MTETQFNSAVADQVSKVLETSLPRIIDSALQRRSNEENRGGSSGTGGGTGGSGGTGGGGGTGSGSDARGAGDTGGNDGGRIPKRGVGAPTVLSIERVGQDGDGVSSA
ncbi:hypothetical protein QVD17_38181 [Tagetes erecta]|uniref:Uncharacterized protein n=1 Tax=Tagetes erecta TaxID=13708 RepID=A0AAD8K1X3_TARER|nr:hypothetical protein QVD17_38181 [Tagetes erecta]